jgi:hypothetical protein
MSLDVVVTSASALAGSAVVFAISLALVWFMLVSGSRHVLCSAYVLVAFLFEIFMVKQPYVEVGLQLYPNDVMSLVVLASIVISSFSRPLPVATVPAVVWLAFGVVMVGSLLQGLVYYGKAAGTEVRDYFYYWAVGLYFLVTPWTKGDLVRVARWYHWGGYALVAIALYRWIGLAIGFVPESLLLEVGVTSVFRALPSHAAFYLAMAGLFHFLAWLRGMGTQWSGVHALAFLGLSIVLQHRSVWIATAVAMLAIIVLENRKLGRRLPLLLALGGIGLTAAGIAAGLGWLDELADAMLRSVVSVLDSRSSVTDRVFGWGSLVEDWAGSSIGTLLLGFPYGHGWRRVIDGRVIEFSPHNFYVDLLLRVGFIGVTLMVLATLMAMAHNFRRAVSSEGEYLLRRGLAVALLANLIFYVPYSGTYMHGAITGLALGLMLRSLAQPDVPSMARPSVVTGGPGRHVVVPSAGAGTELTQQSGAHA